MIRSTLRAASYLARDGVHDSLMIGGWAAGLVVGGLLDLIPAQALRVCANRDYDRAVKMADALADAEAETEVLDPQWQMYGPGTFEIADAATLLDPTASAVVDPSPAIPPVGGDDPAASTPPVQDAAGSTNSELVDLIAEVLHDCRGMSSNSQARKVAERIEKATPPAGFTHGDLVRAATIIRNYADGYSFAGEQRVAQLELHDLANRLADAGHADPTP